MLLTTALVEEAVQGSMLVELYPVASVGGAVCGRDLSGGNESIDKGSSDHLLFFSRTCNGARQ